MVVKEVWVKEMWVHGVRWFPWEMKVKEHLYSIAYT